MGGVRIPADLDPVDTQVRQHLIDELRGTRERNGIGLRTVADLLGCSRTNVHAIEQRTTWEARTLARYARALGWRIEWVLADLELPDDGDVMAIVIAAGDTSTPERGDRVGWRAVCNDLVRVRRATVSVVELGRRLGLHENSLHDWEANYDGSTVFAAQRYARGLGGRLTWILHSEAGAIPRQAS
jgi:hypothetical protein